MNTWQFHLSNWQWVGPMWTFSVSFVYTGLLVGYLHFPVCLYGWSNSQTSPSSNSPLRLFQGIICNINSVIPLIYRVSRFLKNHRRRHQDVLVKMGGNPFRGFVYRMRVKHCFSLIMYGFCSSNAFYLASLSFRMFITILN